MKVSFASSIIGIVALALGCDQSGGQEDISGPESAPAEPTGVAQQASIADSWPIFADETGTIYAIDSSFNLRWYRDVLRSNSLSWRWHSSSGNIIGNSWNGTAHAFSGGAGRIYQVRTSGDLYYYHDINNGTTGWYSGSGNLIGWG